MSSIGERRWNCGMSKTGPEPRICWVVIVATTEAHTSGPRLSIWIEPSTISATKSAPAMGAL
jgi:hypothetical protein